jgi:hypothetical protein
MKTIAALFIALALLVGGCKGNKTAYDSLYTVGHLTDSSYSSYLSLVVTGKAPTNGVPAVSKAYMDFQIAFQAALAVAQFNTNAMATPSLLGASSMVINEINLNK